MTNSSGRVSSALRSVWGVDHQIWVLYQVVRFYDYYYNYVVCTYGLTVTGINMSSEGWRELGLGRPPRFGCGI